MDIRQAETDSEIMSCFPVMSELRPHVESGSFLNRIRRQQESGYMMAYVDEGEGPVAVAGYRIGENLAWGKFLYVDDLVTLSKHRSRGFGAMLLRWLRERADNEGCDQLHLDSGVQRKQAHLFYGREGMEFSSHHYRYVLKPERLAPASAVHRDT